MSKRALVVAGVIVILALYLFSTYNGLVSSEESVKNAWAQVENVYQRRFDLIPNLVETVKGYAAHERETFTEVTEARAKAGSIQLSPDMLADPQKFAQFQESQARLGSALGRLLLIVERYPELKANQNFLELQSQLEGTENRISVERRRFNDVALEYNTRIRRFPTNLIARVFGFQPKVYFQAERGAEKAPKVKF
ncbi:MAG: LemA family protein [Acidobacteria bacterium]|nr:LemA family protein [Acidobacteriota bacterium]